MSPEESLAGQKSLSGDERYWKLGFNPIALKRVDAALRSDEVDEVDGETSSRSWAGEGGVCG